MINKKKWEINKMAAKHQDRMTPENRNMMKQLIEMYDVKTMTDIQDALKDLLGGTIQEMLESELDETLGYEKHEKTDEPKTNYRNGHKPKTLKSTHEFRFAKPPR